MKPSGVVAWRGVSWFDGAPIVAILTGLGSRSANSKTGAMLQLWILHAEVAPLDAIRSGLDASICGDCPHRRDATTGARSCYVNVGQAPRSVYAAYQRGRYPAVSVERLAELCAGQKVRLGAYGDPAFLPAEILRACAAGATLSTGYTHQWRDPRAVHARAFCMASADSSADTARALADGWRVFEVAPAESRTLGSVVCPASEEAGRRTTCADCGLCGGLHARGRAAGPSLVRVISIAPHGSGAKHARARFTSLTISA